MGTTMTPAAAGQMELRTTDFGNLAGWAQDNQAEALRAFLRSCTRLSRSNDALRVGTHSVSGARMAEICAAAAGLGADPQAAQARAFFEDHFQPASVVDDGSTNGLFTGYFEPEFAGSRSYGGDYTVPIYRRPPDLETTNGQYGRRVGGSLQPYYTRREIESGALSGQSLELVYLRSPVDAFFAHIQGSARIALDDGGIMSIAFAAKNGQEYQAIGRVLIDRGAIARENMSMQSIRTWLEANPEAGRDVMWQNPSFIFFQEGAAREPGVGPPGAASVGLTTGRSLAVDKTVYSYGLPMWLETTLPSADGKTLSAHNRLMVAQDTGSAIRGAIRGDVFVGTGYAAGQIAGRMQQDGQLYVLLPRGTAAATPAPTSPASSAPTPEDSLR